MADTWTLTFIDANVQVVTNTYDTEPAFISAVRDQLNDLSKTWVSATLPDGSELNEKALGAKYGLSDGPRVATRHHPKRQSGLSDNLPARRSCQVPTSSVPSAARTLKP
jgi:hypothetical protein